MKGAVIDSAPDFDAAAGPTSTHSANAVIDYIHRTGIALEWVLETHAHADHLSAAPYIQEKCDGLLAIGHEIITVQNVFGEIFNIGIEFARDGWGFDRLFNDSERFSGRR